jgi:hypothetical protein
MACRVVVVTSKRAASANDRGMKQLKYANLNLFVVHTRLSRLPCMAAGTGVYALWSLSQRGCFGQEPMDGRNDLRALTDRRGDALDRS